MFKACDIRGIAAASVFAGVRLLASAIRDNDLPAPLNASPRSSR